MKMNKKGFTLIEMLVVIAIIAVLVSIVIPVVGNSTEKAKLAADAANIRAAIAEVTTKQLGDGSSSDVPVDMQSKGDFSLIEITKIGGIEVSKIKDIVDDGKDVVVYWNTSSKTVDVKAAS